ncbi:hypothetical protein Tco_0056953 [Tanacetum coccineum]
MEPEVLTTVLQPHSSRISRISRQRCQGRLLASFQDDAKYEHVGQDTISQDGKDDKDKQGKDLKILELKTKSKDNDKSSRSKIAKHEGTSLKQDKDQDKAISTKSKEARFKISPQRISKTTY